MMDKYKVCPVCGAHNNPLFLECTECETDLQNVPVVDENMEKEAKNSTVTEHPTSSSSSTRMVRICDCGAKNPVQARRCSECGEDISMIVPVPDQDKVEQRYILSAIDGAFAYEIKKGSTVIGRENEMKEYLSSKPYVSRKHAELILDQDLAVMKIKNCSNTNYTFINNKKISGEMIVELKDGDEIGLGGNEQNGTRQENAAYFILRIGTCI